MSKFWEWLSGKKLIIGGICSWLALNAIPFVMETFNLDLPWMAQVISVLAWISGFLVPVGGVHKVIKAKKK